MKTTLAPEDIVKLIEAKADLWVLADDQEVAHDYRGPALVKFPRISCHWAFYEEFANRHGHNDYEVIWLKSKFAMEVDNRDIAKLRCAYMDALVRMDDDTAAAEIRQLIIDAMDAVEQTGIDAALHQALCTFDREMAQEEATKTLILQGR